MRPAWYNEIDPYAAEWLRRLISAGHLPPGDVDERDIRAVQPDDLAGYGHKHCFAGLGGWAYACRLAGVPDDFDIVTGSPPCQPFSSAGRRRGTADDRHLWPEMARLVASLRPAAVAVENVANVVGMALDGMLADLEGARYSARAFVLPACAVDAPHRRDRVWVVARPVEHADGGGRAAGRPAAEAVGLRPSSAWSERRPAGAAGRGTGAVAGVGALADAGGERRERGPGVVGDGRQAAERRQARGLAGNGGFWDGAGWIAGRDGKARRVPLAPVRELDARLPAGMAAVRPIPLLEKGVPDRVSKLRALGNSIVPQVAAEVIRAMMQTQEDDDAR